jgi:CpcD/allophycocyanin linker domain/Domain of unknown function (DUF1816)
MDRAKLFGGASSSELSNRVFLYEVVIQKQNSSIQSKCPIRPCDRWFIQVPYNRMSQEMQQINRMGGKIVNIEPLSAINENQGVNFLPWWVEIFTNEPRCLYYFGPFNRSSISPTWLYRRSSE